MQGARVQSLVRELRSHLPHDVVKIKRFLKRKKEDGGVETLVLSTESLGRLGSGLSGSSSER